MGFGTFYTILRCYEVTALAATCTGWLSPAVFPGLLALAKVIAASTATTSARDFTAGDFMTARPRFSGADRRVCAATDQRSCSRWPLHYAGRLFTKL
jgi:hypothetical protein